MTYFNNKIETIKTLNNIQNITSEYDPSRNIIKKIFIDSWNSNIGINHLEKQPKINSEDPSSQKINNNSISLYNRLVEGRDRNIFLISILGTAISCMGTNCLLGITSIAGGILLVEIITVLGCIVAIIKNSFHNLQLLADLKEQESFHEEYIKELLVKVAEPYKFLAANLTAIQEDLTELEIYLKSDNFIQSNALAATYQGECFMAVQGMKDIISNSDLATIRGNIGKYFEDDMDHPNIDRIPDRSNRQAMDDYFGYLCKIQDKLESDLIKYSKEKKFLQNVKV